ncbi:MAG: hypothetical protein ACLUNQ_00315 [Oscillospiraceae bacterium]
MADSVAGAHQAAATPTKRKAALWLQDQPKFSPLNLKRPPASPTQAIEKLGLKDDVLRRANGFYTYFAADIAYHRNKFAVRGFDKVINIWGADHHGHVARLKGAMDALGLDGAHRLDIVLMQLVKLVQDGEVVRMSKRTGKAVSLTDLLDMVPVDACRYFFNAKPETQMEFDLGLAVREDSENPVYYVQYAHARICTLLKNLAADGHTVPSPGGRGLLPAHRSRRSWPLSSRSQATATLCAWLPGTTTPASSTAISQTWPPPSTSSTTPAASRARPKTC